MIRAYISEIYESIQGEGPYTGERQIFVRLAGCPLRCNYCDTPGSLVATGHRSWTDQEVFNEIVKLAKKNSLRTVSLTGGEPLIYSQFLKVLLARLKKRKFKIYLETAGVHPAALNRIFPYLDVVSMDMKLPSATGRNDWRAHRAFLKKAGKKAFVKIVVEKKSKADEIRRAVSIITSSSPFSLVVLQPATPMPPAASAPSAAQLAEAYRLATSKLKRVLIMPQQQKIWGVR